LRRLAVPAREKGDGTSLTSGVSAQAGLRAMEVAVRVSDEIDQHRWT
jgi:hypothetical protein